MPRLKKWDDVRRKKFSAAELEEIDREVEEELLEMDLRAIRELLGKTQVEVAEAVEMTQSQVSKLERRGDHRVSTLRRVVGALGGELELIATFGNKRLRLRASD
jgi:DNA-binding phage protein